MLSGGEFKDWLEQLPDEDVEGFEDAVHAAGVEFSKRENDGMMRNCISGFYGDNPYVWAEDSAQSISTNCKGAAEARRIVVTIVNEALEVLGMPAPVVPG